MRCVSSRPERWERVTWRGRVAGRRLEPAGQRAAPGRTGCPAVRVGLGGPASGADQNRTGGPSGQGWQSPALEDTGSFWVSTWPPAARSFHPGPCIPGAACVPGGREEGGQKEGARR